MSAIDRFVRDDSGAVTIDWVALTAGILLLGIAVVYAIFNQGVTNVVSGINAELNSAVVSGIIGPVPNVQNG